MTEVPTSTWTHDFKEDEALAQAPRWSRISAKWRRMPGVVRHVFTHFPLELSVYLAKVPARAQAADGARWVSLADLGAEALPNVMRKVIAHARIDTPAANMKAATRLARDG